MTISANQLSVIKDERADPMYGFDEYKPIYLDPAPEELITFRRLSDVEKRRQWQEFYKQGFIQEYLDYKWVAEKYNRDSLIRLIELREKVSDSDRVRVKQKIIEFCKVIAGYDKPIPALRVDVSKYIENHEKQEELKEVAWDENL